MFCDTKGYWLNIIQVLKYIFISIDCWKFQLFLNLLSWIECIKGQGPD